MAITPERLGRYEILRPLGSGGMGEVYVAHDPLLGRNVAIKILPERLATDRDSLARFTQEARSASALSHPNIVTIYEIGTDHGKPFISMEYIDGRDLRMLINDGPQSNRLTVDIAAQIADGLAAAHEHSIVHRDLKPENVMVTKDGFVKILDFGLAKLIAEGGDELAQTMEYRAPSTMPGTILGTVGYMSPEQATGRKIDFRSDQFALGAILYELATGHAAFERENAIDVMSAILHDNPPPARDFNARVLQPLTWVIDRLLQKEPSGRYPSTREVANELKALRDRIHAEGSAIDLPKPPMMTSKQRRMMGAGIGTAIAVALFAGAVLMNRRQAPLNAPAAAAAQQVKSYVAVLPFTDLSGDANGQLIGDGFAETVSTRLARLPSVQLIRPKPQDIADASDVQKIGRDLGVTMIVRGSMQRAGDRIRISWSIIDVQNRSQLAADTADGAMSELFDVQDKLVTKIASFLDPKAAPQRFPTLDPNVSQQRYLEALGHLRRYDSEDSLNKAVEILESLGTSSATVQAALGRAYLAKFIINRDTKLITKASEYCDRAAASDPLNPDVHVTLGQVRLQTGQTDKAIEEFNRALQQQANNAEAVLGLARTYDALKDTDKAEAAYKKAIELQPKYWSAYNALGVFYFSHAKYPAAAAEFQKVVQISPNNMRAYNNLGAAYQQMGRYDDAIGVYQKTIQQTPTPQAYSNLGTCYYFLGRYKEAAAMFEKAAQLAPSSYRYWANLGDAYRWTIGGEANAKNAYSHAIELARGEVQRNPRDAYIRARLAECLAKHGEIAEGQREIARALADDPANTGVMYRAAIVEAIQGHQEKAASLLKKAVEQGYSRTEVELEPEFAAARKTAVFRQLPTV